MSQDLPFHSHFNQLLLMAAAGEDPDSSTIFTELVRHGAVVSNPLTNFLFSADEDPNLAVLIRLLGKCFDESKVPVLIRFLDSDFPALRRAAANALGWNRARPALEVLYKLELEDPAEEVAEESRAAIDEILRNYPGLVDLVPEHRPLASSNDAAIPAEHDEVPADGADEHQKLKLIAALPRLLALKYGALPLHFSPGDQLHIAVGHGMERRLIATLAEITGHHVQLHGWPLERVRAEMDKFYQLGDDDFCTFHDQLTDLARIEATEAVLAAINPTEPACPLDEANDAVEALQAFLACLVSINATEATVRFEPPTMQIQARTPANPAHALEPPVSTQHERFLDALRVLSGLNPGAGLGRQEGGSIKCHHCSPPFLVAVVSEKSLEHDLIHLHIAYP